jgi:asparagine synthase (glutamine-hydrolysing)
MFARGPDDFGCYRSDAGLALGFRRLSIIDLDTGSQPIANEDGSVQVTLNGEIYNFRELRNQLTGLGHRFATQSDTEVIAHGYEQWGDAVTEHLCGMFGLAIWDERRQRLLLARDRLGIKPLYFAETPEAFGWASDPRALADMPGIASDLDSDALALFLYYGFVPAPWTIQRGIQKLRPGHQIVVTRDAVRIQRYWQLEFEPSADGVPRLRERFAELFAEVVDQHLIADVPIGAFLSGGMDSTAVAMAAGEASGHPLLTFNVGFDDTRVDESGYARQAAETLGTDHREVRLANDPENRIEDALTAFPEPFSDTAAIPNFLLSEEIRSLCTVALSGDGGDELFGGYSLRTAQAVASLRRLPHWTRKVASALPVVGPWAALSLDDAASLFARSRARMTPGPLQALLGNDSQPGRAIEAHLQMMRDDLVRSGARGRTDPMLFLDQTFGLPDQMLTKVDATSMAHSLEVRVPFLDHRVVEFAATLPDELKQKGLGPRRSKRLIRWYLARRFPPVFIHRSKLGFGLPIVGPLLTRLRTETGSRDGLLMPDGIDTGVLAAQVAAGELSDAALWKLFALSVWHRNRTGATPGS